MKYVILHLILFSSIIFSQNYPNDSYYLSGLQWYIHNDYSGNPSLRNDVDIDILEAWDITKGDPDVVIAILDSGIPMANGVPSHNDLKNPNRIILGEDYVNDSAPFNDIYSNPYRHGTRIAGIAGAETNNGEGIAGIAPQCKLMIYKVLGNESSQWANNIYNAILHIVSYKNQHPNLRFVINISIGFKVNDPILENAISLAQSNNILVVAGAGNVNGYSGFDVLYPAKYSVNYDNVISVASITKKGDWASEFSCYGPEVTVCAPGTDMWSTIPSNSYATAEGTSYSSPIVAGLAALILSLDKDLTPAQIKNRIINSATDVGETGFDHKTGYGLVNAYNALAQLYVEKNSELTKMDGNLNLTRQAENIHINITGLSPSGVAGGSYIADRYVATKTVNHSLINSASRYLGMKGYVYAESKQYFSPNYYFSENITNNASTYTTYFYYIKRDIYPGIEVNKWVPWSPYIDGGLKYSIIGEAPATPVISYFTQTPDPICQGSYGYVYCNLSQGNGTLTYTWSATDLPAGAYITPMGNKCKVTYSTALSAKDAGVDQIMAPIAQIYCTVSNSAGSDNKSMTPSFSTNCGGCPTLAFNNGTEKVDENTLLISSLSNPDVDVTDYYLINTSDKYKNGNIEFIIHEPSEEHSWFDEIELWELKANKGEFIAVTDEGEFINFKEKRI